MISLHYPLVEEVIQYDIASLPASRGSDTIWHDFQNEQNISQNSHHLLDIKKILKIYTLIYIYSPKAFWWNWKDHGGECAKCHQGHLP